MSARPRPKREQVATSDRVARPHGTVAPFRRFASPYFLEANDSQLSSASLGRGMRRENEQACLLSVILRWPRSGPRRIRPRRPGPSSFEARCARTSG